MAKKAVKKGEEKMDNVAILVAKFKTRPGWNVLVTNKKMATIEAVAKTHEAQIEKTKLYQLNAETGEITKLMDL